MPAKDPKNSEEVTVKLIGIFKKAFGKGQTEIGIQRKDSLETAVEKLCEASPTLKRVLMDPELGIPLPSAIILVNGVEIGLLKGLKTDPLFQMMLSKYIAKKREFFRFKNEFDYKQLDLHLHKSKILSGHFEALTGKEKYELVRNMVAIRLFLQEKELSKETVDKEIEILFGKSAVYQLTENLLEKRSFLKKYKVVYGQTFNQVMQRINPT